MDDDGDAPVQTLSRSDWDAQIVRLLKGDKTIHFYEEELCEQLYKDAYDPITAVCMIQDLRDGGDGIAEDD